MLAKIVLLTLCFDSSAYVVPADPWDPALATDLLEALYRKGVAVQRATTAFDANGKHYPAGTRIIPATPLLDALSIEMGVPVEPLDVPAAVPLERITSFHAEGLFRGQGKMTTLNHRDNSSFIATAFLLDRYEGVSWTANGNIILNSWYADGFARAENFSKQFVVRVTLTDDPGKAAYELHRPRVGLLNAPAWLTSLMDENAAPYDSVEALSKSFDTIVTTAPGDFSTFLAGGGTVIQLPAEAGAPRRISIETASPMAFGMPPETRVMAAASPDISGEAVAKFENGEPAMTAKPVGKGQLITFAFRPQPGTVKLLLNAIYLASATRLK